MYIHIERFGQTYTFGVEEGILPIEDDGMEVPDEQKDSMPRFKENPEICLIEAVDAVSNLLRCVFPEMEGHHLEITEDNPESNSRSNEGGIDLGKH
jgi:hypothetical protein